MCVASSSWGKSSVVEVDKRTVWGLFAQFHRSYILIQGGGTGCFPLDTEGVGTRLGSGDGFLGILGNAVMIHPNYFSPPLDQCHLQAPSSYQSHQYLSLTSHYPSSLQPRQGCLCKWIQPMFHYHLWQREPQMTNYGYSQMPPPYISCHSSFICNPLSSSTTVKPSEENPLAQSTMRYTSPF